MEIPLINLYMLPKSFQIHEQVHFKWAEGSLFTIICDS